VPMMTTEHVDAVLGFSIRKGDDDALERVREFFRAEYWALEDAFREGKLEQRERIDRQELAHHICMQIDLEMEKRWGAGYLVA
jgi:hypothetical protein